MTEARDGGGGRSAWPAGTTRTIPFAEHVRFGGGYRRGWRFEESSDLSIAVAGRVLPSWARAGRLTCVRTAGVFAGAGGRRALVVVDKDRRGGRATVRRSHRRGVGGQPVGRCVASGISPVRLMCSQPSGETWARSAPRFSRRSASRPTGLVQWLAPRGSHGIVFRDAHPSGQLPTGAPVQVGGL